MLPCVAFIFFLFPYKFIFSSGYRRKRVSLSKSEDVKLPDISIKGAASEDGLGDEAEEGVEERFFHCSPYLPLSVIIVRDIISSCSAIVISS